MGFAQALIHKVPLVLLGSIIVLFSIAFSIAGLFIIRLFLSHQKRKIHNDIAGPIFATVGVVYAVLLTFIVVAAWGAFEKAESNVEEEANCLGDLFASSIAFNQDHKIEINGLLEKYRQAVISEEWPLLARGQSSHNVDMIIKNIWKFYAKFNPENKTQEIFLTESVKRLNQLGELRRVRLFDSRRGVNEILWFVLIVGGIITLIFSFLFGTENFGIQIFMTVLLAVIIGLIIFTIMEIDYPFTGNFSIKPEAFQRLAVVNWLD